MSKPISLIAGRRSAAVRKVPEVQRPDSSSKVAPSERGKNSYQALKAASLRSTRTGYVADGLSSSRTGRRSRTARTSSVRPASRRSWSPRAVSRSPVAASCRTAASAAGALLRGGAFEQPRALLEHEGHVDPGLDLDRRVVVPGAVRVRPALDAQAPQALGVGGQGGDVGVLARVDARHAHRRPVGPVGPDEDGRGRDGVVALAEDGGAHGDQLTRHGLRGPASTVHDGLDVEHGDAAHGGLPGPVSGPVRTVSRSCARSCTRSWSRSWSIVTGRTYRDGGRPSRGSGRGWG